MCFTRNLKGVVLLSHGTGNMSDEVMDVLEELLKGDRIIVNITSCLKGGVATNTSLKVSIPHLTTDRNKLCDVQLHVVQGC